MKYIKADIKTGQFKPVYLFCLSLLIGEHQLELYLLGREIMLVGEAKEFV